MAERVGSVERPSAEGPDGGFNAILFTDIEGSTAMTQRLGDDRARELMREYGFTVDNVVSRAMALLGREA